MSDQPPGALARYLEREGSRYFEWQNALGKWAGIWNARFFQPSIGSDARILDFGCGGGHLLAALKARYKVGVEVNPAARRVADGYGIRTVTTLDELEGETFDVAISSHALEHVVAPFDTLLSLRRRLVPSGELLLLLPLDDWRSSGQRRFHKGDISMHLHCWTPLTLGNLLCAAGFDPVKIQVVTHAFPPYGIQLWNIGRPLFEAAATLTSLLKRRRQLLAYARLGAGNA